MKDYYKILEVDPDATLEEIKKSYYKLAFKYHPDRTDYVKSKNLFTELSEAYDVLSSEKKRTEYNQKRQDVSVVTLNKSKDNGSTPFTAEKTVEKEYRRFSAVEDSPGGSKGNFDKGMKRLLQFGAILSLLLLLDFILPAKITQENAVEISNPVTEVSTNDWLLTDQGSRLLISREFSSRALKLKEISVYRTLILSRFYKITLQEWPFTVPGADSNHALLLILACTLFLFSIYGLVGSRFSNPNLMVCGIGSGILCILCILLIII